MTNEEIKNEFINCIEGSHTLNLAISILEDREELQQRIDKAMEYIRNNYNLNWYVESNYKNKLLEILKGGPNNE